MNLALEYLIRSKAIREFLTTPCSLFLQRNGQKISITFEKAAVDDDFHLKRWHITDCRSASRLPEYDECVVASQELFDSPFFRLPGWEIMPYHEETVDTSLNSPRESMSDDTYQDFIDRFLYTPLHRYRKADWLWEAFAKVASPNDADVRRRHKNLKWIAWKRAVLLDRDCEAAPELVFLA